MLEKSPSVDASFAFESAVMLEAAAAAAASSSVAPFRRDLGFGV